MDSDETLLQMRTVHPQIRPSLRTNGCLYRGVQPQVLLTLSTLFPLEHFGNARDIHPINAR